MCLGCNFYGVVHETILFLRHATFSGRHKKRAPLSQKKIVCTSLEKVESLSQKVVCPFQQVAARQEKHLPTKKSRHPASFLPKRKGRCALASRKKCPLPLPPSKKNKSHSPYVSLKFCVMNLALPTRLFFCPGHAPRCSVSGLVSPCCVCRSLTFLFDPGHVHAAPLRPLSISSLVCGALPLEHD